MLLRLANLLNRARAPLPTPALSLSAEKDRLLLRAAGDWLADHPLTRLDLEEECRLAAGLGMDCRAA